MRAMYTSLGDFGFVFESFALDRFD